MEALQSFNPAVKLESKIFGTRTIASGFPCFIIAEIGTAHNGSLNKAYELIEAAAESGADCAKFQIVLADEIIHPETGDVPLPGGSIPLYQRFKKLETGEEFFLKIKEYTEKKGLFFLGSVFGVKSAGILKNIGGKAVKIASPELNHYPLLTEVKSYAIPVILSTGVSTVGDIEKALRIIGLNSALLHCITSYPAPEDEYNITVIPNIRNLFGVPAGVSDHSLDPILVPVLSVIMGGCLVEKHLCLKRSKRGLDDPIALPPQDFKIMVDSIRTMEIMEQKEALNYLKQKYGQEKIDIVLGNGVKTLAQSEISNYETTRRTIHALTFIPAGTILSEDNCALLRSEKKLRPGLPPEFFHVIIGKKTVQDIPPGEGIRWDDLF
ncbi:MAG: N-acetylneuraminate synthase family protein [Spirochaetota bacterium]